MGKALTMTEQETEEAIERIATLFEACSQDSVGHRWDFHAGKCQACGKEWPYAKFAHGEDQK